MSQEAIYFHHRRHRSFGRFRICYRSTRRLALATVARQHQGFNDSAQRSAPREIERPAARKRFLSGIPMGR